MTGHRAGSAPAISPQRHAVCVVDDDTRIREAIRDLLVSAGYKVETFDWGIALLTRDRELPDHSDLGIIGSSPSLQRVLRTTGPATSASS